MKEKDNRPVFLNPLVLVTNLPIIGVSSILHRISGFAVFVIFLSLVWLFDRSLTSEDEFLKLVQDMNTLFLLKLLLFFISLGLTYHVLIGIKKLTSEFFGVGEELKSGNRISWAYNILFIFLSLFLLVRILF